MTPLCMFCGSEISTADLTMEHFIPQGLWEKGHLPTKMKTLPAHKCCNQSFAADNEYFRDVLAMEDGAARHPAAKQLQSGAIRRKFNNRFGSIVNTLKNLGIRRVRTRSGIELGGRPSFEVDWTRLERVLANAMKGIFYVSQERPMPQHFRIFVSDVRHVNRDWVETVAKFMVPWQSFGDTAFCCRYVVSSREPIEKMTCLMQFYEHRLFVGEAIDPALLGKDGEVFVPASPDSPIVVPRWSAER